MRWAVAALLLLGCTKAAGADVAATLVVPPAPRVVEDAKLPLALALGARRPMWPTHAEDAAWVRTLPKAKGFASVDGFVGVPEIALTWRVHPSRRVPGTESEKEEYAGLYEAQVELVLASGTRERAIDLGFHSGNVEGGEVSACERAGYRHANADYRFSFADMPSRVAFWEMGTMQGGSEFLVVLGTDGMHVLRRDTHDGACPVTIKQGPLEVCADMKWERLLEIPVAGEPRVSERAVDLDGAGVATPIDCKASYSGADLVAPGD